MPPKANDSMKQKSLMSFFGKPADPKPSPANKLAVKPKEQTSGASKSQPQQSTAPRSQEVSTLDESTPTSSAEFSTTSTQQRRGVQETPLTSDPIDVDMLSADEEEIERVQTKKVSVLYIYIYACP